MVKLTLHDYLYKILFGWIPVLPANRKKYIKKGEIQNGWYKKVITVSGGYGNNQC